jgi:hypothetical protein
MARKEGAIRGKGKVDEGANLGLGIDMERTVGWAETAIIFINPDASDLRSNLKDGYLDPTGEKMFRRAEPSGTGTDHCKALHQMLSLSSLGWQDEHQQKMDELN